MPSISQPVQLALAQRLTGQVANGDLARSNFSGDYTPKILRTDTIDGEPYHVLELTAVDRGVTYHKVIYWVKQSNNWPHRAEFLLTVQPPAQDRPLRELPADAGQTAADSVVMEDALRKGEESVLEYSGMRLRDRPTGSSPRTTCKDLNNPASGRRQTSGYRRKPRRFARNIQSG